jgi:hypothetical protein
MKIIKKRIIKREGEKNGTEQNRIDGICGILGF